MHLPTRLSAQHPLLKIAAALLIALFSSALAAGIRANRFVRNLDNVIYDAMYILRPPEDLSGGGVVILAVDERSLRDVDKGMFGDPFGWPWPRVAWAMLIPYLERCGAKVVAFDLLFSERSTYQGELSDDDKLAEAINSAKIPVVLGTNVSRRDGSPGRLAPKVKSPIFGAVNYEYGQFRQ